MEATSSHPIAYLKIDNTQLHCCGDWTLAGIPILQTQIKKLQWPKTKELILDGSQIKSMDTAGAWFLRQLLSLLQQKNYHTELKACSDEHQKLLSLVEDSAKATSLPPSPAKITWLAQVGMTTVAALNQAVNFLSLLGEVFTTAWRWIRQPRRIQWTALLNTVDMTGYRALPIIALLSFLIGIVLAYQMGLQLRNYGANIFVVDLIGLSLLREFAPLMTAIIIAGRSGSAFTAQLGTMQVNEEIDALRTMGIAPVERLVMQKFFGLIIALPLLTVWSDIVGVLGGMLMANKMLDVNYSEFLHRFQNVIALKTYVIGLSKTPVFAMIIACIGCFQGFQVKGSADSVGQETTKSVVRAIFLIICADAFFSVLFSWYGV